MNTIRITDLPLVTSVDTSDDIVVVKDGVTSKIKASTGGGLDVDTVQGRHGGLTAGDLLILGTGDKAALGLGSAAELDAGSANGVATLGADGKVPVTELPSITITDTFPVASQAAMLALTAQKGDVAVRSDENKTYILREEPATVLANWEWLKTPTDNVLSVDGKTGAVDLSGDYAEIWDATTNFVTNKPAFYNGVPYKSLQTPNINHIPSDTIGVYWEVTGGGGSSSNPGYTFLNGDAELNLVGWEDNKCTVPAEIPDGTFAGSANICLLTRNTTAPLNGIADFLFTKSGSASAYGEEHYYDFTIDKGQTSSPAQITFNYLSDSVYAGDVGVFLWDKTNNALIRMSVETLPSSYGSVSQFLTTFIPSNSTTYRLIFHVVNALTTNWTLHVDNIQVGQKNVAVGAAIGNWIDYVPAKPLNTTGNYLIAKYRRNGSSIDIWLNYELIAATSNFILLLSSILPTGLTIANTTVSGIPFVWLRVGGAGYAGEYNGYQFMINGNVLSNNFPTTTGVGDRLMLNYSVPIAQWTSNVNLASDFTEYAYNTSLNTTTSDSTSFGYGSAGNGFGSITLGLKRRVRFQRPIQATDKIVVELSPDGVKWLDSSLGYSNYTSFNIDGAYAQQITASYGIGLPKIINSTDVDISFGTYSGVSSAAYGGVGFGWNVVSDAGGRWRVRKVSNGNMAEQVGVVKDVGDQRISGVKLFTAGLGSQSILVSCVASTPVAFLTLTSGYWIIWQSMYNSSVYGSAITVIVAEGTAMVVSNVGTGFTLSGLSVRLNFPLSMQVGVSVCKINTGISIA